MSAPVAAATSTAEIAERVREAAAASMPLRIVGRGHWLDAGRPVRATDRLALDALTGIVDYTAGDLTLTARAGTTLQEIAHVTAGERQWLALDPAGPLTGTLGATIATASAGPLAHALGAPRDAVLGLEVVTGTGEVVHTGGRVVKNVAGFDLTRLFTGSWGTLAVITEVTVRLRALPAVDETVALALPMSAHELDSLLTRVRAAPIAPIALELVSAPLAERIALPPQAVLLARLGGNVESVRAQRAVLESIARAAIVPRETWGALRVCEPPGASVVRLSALPARLAPLWSAARDANASLPGALAHASLGRGVVRCIAPSDDDEALGPWLEAIGRLDATRIFERLPPRRWSEALAPSPVADRLSRDVKRAFDPHGVLNPGLFGERS